MKVCVTAISNSLDASLDPHFGRCLYFIIIDGDSTEFTILKNASAFSSDGAGVQAAQLILNREIDVLITGYIGPKAFSILSSKGIDVLTFADGSVSDALKACKSNVLEKLDASNSPVKDRYEVPVRRIPRTWELI
ncbi:NifB/NifX family molybdenum-iron cluster-binding protein [uncultured Methanolobus sp.]|uniref:NifB/NifX family molybdenum-iron cluster-binding protein n=1 Tax=uncultured Methanolobus sp. TaxID=218300 RepID=UPI003747D0F0